jgi:hypothetical protein
MPGPHLLPKPKREERRVFLPKELWKRLDDCAEFHQEAFDVLGAKESVSRNDIIEVFMGWAIKAYWADRGGYPENARDRAEKARAFAESMRKTDQK